MVCETAVPGGFFNLDMVKIVSLHAFSKGRATRGFVPALQPHDGAIEAGWTILEQNGLIETPNLRRVIGKWLQEQA